MIEMVCVFAGFALGIIVASIWLVRVARKACEEAVRRTLW